MFGAGDGGPFGFILLCHISPLPPRDVKNRALALENARFPQVFPGFVTKVEKSAFNGSCGVLLCSHQPEIITPVTSITS